MHFHWSYLSRVLMALIMFMANFQVTSVRDQYKSQWSLAHPSFAHEHLEDCNVLMSV